MPSAFKTELVQAGGLVALGMLLGYIESLIPPFLPVPGVKIGFSNVVVLFSLFCFSVKLTCLVGLVKGILTGLLFSGPVSIFYSVGGILFALFIMCLLKRLFYTKNYISIFGISVAGSAFFQVGQILVACLLLKSLAPAYYLGILLIISIFSGLVCGFVAKLLLERLRLL